VKWGVVLAGFLVALASVSVPAQQWSGWSKLEGAAVQLWARGFGTMEALCSAAAVRGPNGKIYLLSAGHCAILPVLWSATQDGTTFFEAKVVASGWKAKGDVSAFVAKVRSGLSVSSLSEIPADTSEGDWAIFETQMKPKEVLGVSSAKISMGDAVFIVSFPIGGDRFGSSGVVANASYSAPGTPWDKYIATDLTALPGSSGAGVVNANGEIVGILVAGVGQSRLHLATPIRLVKWEKQEGK
jgi:hypothetical protein